MKRALLCMLLVLSVITACTGQPEQSAVERVLLEEWSFRWEQSGYPDDVGGVYYDDSAGRYVLMLTEEDERVVRRYTEELAGEYAIEYCEYSMNELRAVQSEIEKRMQSEPDGGKIYSAGVGWKADGGFGPSGKEFRVIVTVDENVYEQLFTELETAYGDMVDVEKGEQMRLDG